ncbi:MAG: hypothetical protein P4M11_08655 [Candidatus Pacebacteria bacterium]|nr:hypothetical protein [Candidatus Paceibacterota bacterium]
MNFYASSASSSYRALVLHLSTFFANMIANVPVAAARFATEIQKLFARLQTGPTLTISTFEISVGSLYPGESTRVAVVVSSLVSRPVETFLRVDRGAEGFGDWNISTCSVLTLAPFASRTIDLSVKAPMACHEGELRAALVVKADSGQELTVSARGKVVLPRVRCGRELYCEETRMVVIPVVARLRLGPQNIRLPFSNVGGRTMKLAFAVHENVPCQEHIRKSIESGSYWIEYYCIPGEMEMRPEDTGLLGLVVKLLGTIPHHRHGKVRDRKVLTAKVRGTQLVWLFLLDMVFL